MPSNVPTDRSSSFEGIWLTLDAACRRGRGELVDTTSGPVDVSTRAESIMTPDHQRLHMDIRGERECTDCGSQWSYYETGEIACPECGSVRSVGVGERRIHTAGTATLDLSSVLAAVDDEPLRTLADRASEACRSYVASVGFVDAGELRPLSETYLAACELRRVGATLGRVMDPTPDQERYFYALLQSADGGERPPPEDVPQPLRPERGLAVAAAIRAYLRDLRRVHTDHDEPVATVISGVTTRRKRIEALDGDVEPATAEQLVRAVRDLGTYLRDDDETALARAVDRVETETR